MRFMPRSLGGQMALLLGLALFVAQLANFALILNERQKLSLSQNQGPAITRFAGVAADLAQASPEFRKPIVADASHRGARFALAVGSGISDGERGADIEARLASALDNAGIRVRAARATDVQSAEPQVGGIPRDNQYLRLAIQTVDGAWLTARIATPRRDPWLPARLAAATLLLYLLVLGATVWIAMRLARPLRNLTRAAEAFGGRSQPEIVPATGPSDLRRAIDAFNAMNLRVIALLDEKDRMLGAIGHDMRTPLASLRIRIESMEPEGERDAAIAKIADMTAMLEDILMLARTGRARDAARPVDLVALVDAVLEEYRALGHPIAMTAPPRVILAVQPSLIQRAIRNLVDNAIAYGGGAQIGIDDLPDRIDIRISDNGPGIPEAQMASVLQPFVRLEGSRNRDTGGTGLGLPIAASIAESHGGSLALHNAAQGLVATISLPREQAGLIS